MGRKHSRLPEPRAQEDPQQVEEHPPRVARDLLEPGAEQSRVLGFLTNAYVPSPGLRSQADPDHEELVGLLRRSLEHRVREVESRMLDRLAVVEAAHEALRRDTFSWLETLSMPFDPSEAELTRYLPVKAYISSSEESDARMMGFAVHVLVGAARMDLLDLFPPEHGSWFKRWVGRTKETLTHPELVERLEKMERAIENQLLNIPQATADRDLAEGAALLLQALERTDRAAIQIGSLLVVKAPDREGRPAVIARSLTTRELILLSKNPDWLKDPVGILGLLIRHEVAVEIREPERSRKVHD